MKRHLRSRCFVHHKVDYIKGHGRYHCQKCTKSYASYGALVNHEHSSHDQAQHHRCDACGKAYNLKGNLHRHIRKNHDKSVLHDDMVSEDETEVDLDVIMYQPLPSLVPSDVDPHDVYLCHKCGCLVFKNNYQAHKLEDKTSYPNWTDDPDSDAMSWSTEHDSVVKFLFLFQDTCTIYSE